MASTNEQRWTTSRSASGRCPHGLPRLLTPTALENHGQASEEQESHWTGRLGWKSLKNELEDWLHKGFTGCHTCIYRCQVEVACIDQSPLLPLLLYMLWCEYLVQCNGGAAYSGHGQTEKDRSVERERVRWETSQTERRTGPDAAGAHWENPSAPERHGNIRFCRNEGESKCQGVLVRGENLRGIGIQCWVDCM